MCAENELNFIGYARKRQNRVALFSVESSTEKNGEWSREREKILLSIICHLFMVVVFRCCYCWFFPFLCLFVINNAKNGWKWNGRNVINFCVFIWTAFFDCGHNWNSSAEHSRNMVIKRIKMEQNKTKIEKLLLHMFGLHFILPFLHFFFVSAAIHLAHSYSEWEKKQHAKAENETKM